VITYLPIHETFLNVSSEAKNSFCMKSAWEKTWDNIPQVQLTKDVPSFERG